MNIIARIHCPIVALVAAQQILLEVWFLRMFGFVHQDLRKFSIHHHDTGFSSLVIEAHRGSAY